LVATISVKEDCVYETRKERPRNHLELTILSSCRNSSFTSLENYYAIDKCKKSVPEDEKEFVQVKFFKNEYNIYCAGSFCTIGNRQVVCPDNVFTLPLSMSFTLNDVKYSGDILKIIYKEPDDPFLKEHTDWHLNPKINWSNISNKIGEDWTNNKDRIRKELLNLKEFEFKSNGWTSLEIVLLIILIAVLITVLLLSWPYFKNKCHKGLARNAKFRASAAEDKVSEQEATPLQQGRVEHQVIVNA